MHHIFWTGLIIFVVAFAIAFVIPLGGILLMIVNLARLVGLVMIIVGIVLTLTRRRR
jgi:hypothetical protein